MRRTAVDSAVTHYRTHHWGDLRTLDDVELLLAAHPDDQAGNLSVAQYLWGYNYWNRVPWMRGLVRWLRVNGLTTHEALHAWAHRSDFHRDFEGQIRHLGIAAYKWLVMRLGVDTVKPDVHLHNFVTGVVGHRVTDETLVAAIEAVAAKRSIRARELDAAIWEFQRGWPA
jgi:hypothetical protein